MVIFHSYVKLPEGSCLTNMLIRFQQRFFQPAPIVLSARRFTALSLILLIQPHSVTQSEVYNYKAF